jgi:predicted AAA+ superfamily ATPase
VIIYAVSWKRSILQDVQVIIDDLTVHDIDEALSHLRLKLQDRYGNRLSFHQREFYLEQVDDLLDARIELKAYENNAETNLGTNARPE